MPKIHEVGVIVGADFQDFDHGKEVKVYLPDSYNELCPVIVSIGLVGDSMAWLKSLV